MAADDLPEGFEPDAPPEGFEVDAPAVDPSNREALPREAIAGRKKLPLYERARAAARKMKEYGGIDHLDADEKQALKEALAQNAESKKIGTGEAMLGLGLNTAGGEMGDEAAGMYGALKGGRAAGDEATADARDYLSRALEQHPVAGRVGQAIGGTIPALFGPAGGGGKLLNLAQGAVTGAGAGENWRDRVTGGIGGAAFAHGANELAGPMIAGGVEAMRKGAVGAAKTLRAPQALIDWMSGAKAPVAPPAAVGPEVATLEEQLADAAAANPDPANAVTKTGVAPGPSVNDATRAGVLPASATAPAGELTPGVPTKPAGKPQAGDLSGLGYDQLPKQVSDPAQEKLWMDEVNAQGAQKETPWYKPGSMEPADEAALEKLRAAGDIQRAREPWAMTDETNVAMPWETPESPSGRNASMVSRQAEDEFQQARERQGWDIDSRVTPYPGGGIHPQPAAQPNQSIAPPAPAPGTMADRKARLDSMASTPEMMDAFGMPKAQQSPPSRSADLSYGSIPVEDATGTRRNERGFGSIDLLATLAGIKPVGAAAKIGARAADKAGQSIENAAEKWKPSAVAAKLATDDSALSQLATRGGRLGQVAAMLMQTKQQQGPDAAKAQAYIVAQQPWFQAQLEQGTYGPPSQDQSPMLP